MRRGPWWEGATPVEAPTECGGARHQLRWQRGDLLASDHPDPNGELLLCSLGGPTPRCLHLVELWRGHTSDILALTLGSRAPDDQPSVALTAIEGHTPQFLPPPTRRDPTALAGLLPRYFDLRVEARWQAWQEALELLTLAPPLQIRWAAGVADHLLGMLPATPQRAVLLEPIDLRANPTRMTIRDVEQSADGIARAILDAALYGRARRAVHRWLGAPTPLTIERLASDGTPRFEQTGDGVHLALRHDWLTRVWGHDLAVINGAFTVDAVLTDPVTGTLHLTSHTGATTVHHPQLGAAS
jgi:hypothetical protein